jgi:long-subunit acyl-CoA synthetase (AMP-forming)
MSLSSPSSVLPSLKQLIIIKNGPEIPFELANFLPFHEIPRADVDLTAIANTLSEYDVINLQFTSGTTGSPKAAMLTHQ